jgi:hemolysin activation/secretion protein
MISRIRAPLCRWLLPAALFAAVSAFAQDAVPRFDVERYAVEGNTLLPVERVSEVTRRFAGKKRDFGDLQRAMEALEDAYRSAGYTTVLVTLPEQELNLGVVKFRVVEGRIAKVTITGNQHFSNENIRASLPSLQEGQPPKTEDLGASLRAANENASKQTQLVLRAGDKEGEIEAAVTVKDEDPLKYFAMLDNTGNEETGISRLSLGFQHNNIGDRDQVLTLRATTAMEKPDKVAVVGAGYHLPLYGLGDSIDAFAGYSNVDSGTVANLFSVTGSGQIYGLRYNNFLPRIGTMQQKLVFGVDYREYNNRTLPLAGGASVTPNYTVQPASIAYEGQWSLPRMEATFTVSWIGNMAGKVDCRLEQGGNTCANAPVGISKGYDQVRRGARQAYALLRLGATYSRQFENDWQLRLAVTAQHTDDLLVPAEQFGIGGASSVRGFGERIIAADRGIASNLELYTPDFGKEVGENASLRGLFFYDTGRVWRNRPLAGESPEVGIAGIGMGIRFGYGKNFSLRLDAAQPSVADSSPRGAVRVKEKSVHLGMGLQF